MKKVILLLFLSLKIVIASELTPLNFDKKIDEGVVSKEYILKNSSDKIIKYSVYMEKSQENFDMTNWINITPQSFMLKPEEKKKIFLTVDAPKNMEKGEYLSNLCIEEIEVIGAKSKINILSKIRVELAGIVGETHSKLNLKGIEIISDSIILNLENIGKIREKCTICFLDENEKLISTQKIRLFSQESRKVVYKDKKCKSIIVYDKNKKMICKKKIES